MAIGKVITTHLIDGNPNGIRNIFISNKTCNMYVIPRELMTAANENSDINLNQPALYILLGGKDDYSSMPQAYIGQTESFKERVKEHESKKDFWSTALVFISKANDQLNRADVKFLESLSIKTAKESKTYDLSANKKDSSSPILSPSQRDSNLEFFEDVKLLTAFFGCYIFKEIKVPKSNSSKSKYFLKIADCDATAIYENGYLTVLAGSIISLKPNPSFRYKERWEKEVRDLTEIKEGKRILKINVPDKSPSGAAQFVYGGQLNGWLNWKDDKGNPLDNIRVK